MEVYMDDIIIKSKKVEDYLVDLKKLFERLRRMSSRFFLNGEVLYKRTSDLGLLRCIDEEETDYMMKEEVCQISNIGDVMHAPSTELHSMTAPWPCSIWGMDVIGTIDPPASNRHRFILVAIKYFTKWVEAASYNHVTKKVVSDFLKNNIICHFGVPETLITDNAKNLNNDMVNGLCEQFKVRYQNFAIYRSQINGAVEAVNKNLKKIIRKMTEAHRNWHEKLPYGLMAYRTTIRTSTGATPYSLICGMEAVLFAEVEIPSLCILIEAQIDEAEWVRKRYEQLSLIDEKRLNVICHDQCYQQRMAYTYNKKIKFRLFEVGDKILKRILPMQEETKGKFAPK
ncbi:uncharacterized protein [Coffea arabica]|uniref:Integrase catalytic domain-containing protein n=1 Tax=Coffea arabica TaxID=13443 RepID=A0A6P6VKB0_COFAR|nr:uncharacterized protein LOC113724417 [Coffea arabica]